MDSVALLLKPRDPSPAALDETTLVQVVKAAFAKRRKTLKNTLAAAAGAFGLAPESMLQILGQLNIDPGRRAETLSLAQFVEISNLISRAKTAF